MIASNGGEWENKNMRKTRGKIEYNKNAKYLDKDSTLGFIFILFSIFFHFVITKWNRIYYGELVAHNKVEKWKTKSLNLYF